MLLVDGVGRGLEGLAGRLHQDKLLLLLLLMVLGLLLVHRRGHWHQLESWRNSELLLLWQLARRGDLLLLMLVLVVMLLMGHCDVHLLLLLLWVRVRRLLLGFELHRLHVAGSLLIRPLHVRHWRLWLTLLVRKHDDLLRLRRCWYIRDVLLWGRQALVAPDRGDDLAGSFVFTVGRERR